MLSRVKVGDIVYTSKFGPGQVVGIDPINAYPVQVVRFPNYFHDTGAEFAWDGIRKGDGAQPGCWPIMHPNVPKENLPCLLQHAKVGDKVVCLGRGEYNVTRVAKVGSPYPICLCNKEGHMFWVSRDGKVWRSDISPSVFLTHSTFEMPLNGEGLDNKEVIRNVKVGDLVFTIQVGWVCIDKISEYGDYFRVEFGDKAGPWYESISGKFNATDKYPSAWPKGHPDIPHWAPPCPDEERPKFDPFNRVM